MKILVKAKTKAKVEKVERVEQPALDLPGMKNQLPLYKVSVKEAPVNGQANEAIILALAEYFNKPRSNIKLISGQTSKQKMFEVL